MNIFNQIQINKPKSNKFDLSHEKKLSLDMAKLVPIYLEEIVPGDRFQVSSEILLRMAPMLAPIMHRVNVYTHYFFVPNRLVWDNWKDFITGGEDGTDTFVFPTSQINEGNKSFFAKGQLSDYFGLPIDAIKNTIAEPLTFSMLPFRGYQLIYNEYYRDQTLESKVPIDKGDGGATNNDQYLIRRRAWEKDYFTSALPFPQRGADVQLPVSFNYKDIGTYVDFNGAEDTTGNLNVDTGLVGTDATGNFRGNIQNLEEDATSVTINELRNANRLQEWLEKNARAGSRYIEQILSHFGVRSSDARLQRPEYLGGGKSPVVISEVLQTSPTTTDVYLSDTPLGEMAGHGVSVGKNHGFTKSFEEHGYVFGIMSVMPRTTYQNGLDRMWNKFDKLDYYWPEFAHLGEQEILNKEIYYDGTDTNLESTFGYTPRYAEYKYKQSSVHGDFRDELSYWHLGRQFSTAPALNADFVKADPREDIFAVTEANEHKLYCQIYNSVKAIRPMPYYGTPYL